MLKKLFRRRKPTLRDVMELLAIINHKEDRIMATQAQLAEELRALRAQVERNRQEVLAKIAALEEALANAGETSEEVNTALTELKATVQASDDDVVPATEG